MKKVLLIILTFFVIIPSLYGAPIKIAFFFGRSEGDVFWGKVLQITQAACRDLGMKVEAYWADGSHVKMTKQIASATSKEDRPDVLLLFNFLGNLPRILDLTREKNVNVFVYNGSLDYDKTTIRKKDYPNWIGEMLPNDEQAGYRLSEHLIKQALKKKLYAEDGKIHMIGIEGIIASLGSKERVKGLKRSIQGHENDVKFHQIVTANWERDEAKRKFKALMSRYPETTVVWSASDLMADGVAEGVRELGKIPGKQIITGGVDWTTEGLKAVNDGTFSASVGGHIWEGAWVATLIYDYYNGINNSDYIHKARTEMLLLDKENLATYTKYFSDEDYDKVDFKKFSKAHNPKLKKYDFRLEKVYEQFRKQ